MQTLSYKYLKADKSQYIIQKYGYLYSGTLHSTLLTLCPVKYISGGGVGVAIMQKLLRERNNDMANILLNF